MFRQFLQILFCASIFIIATSSFTLTGSINHGEKLHESTTQILEDVSERFPEITDLYQVGVNSWNRKILAVKMTKTNGIKHLPQPHILLTTDKYKDETLGRELLIRFIKYLISRHRDDTKISWILENSHIHVIPSINPISSWSEIGNCKSDEIKPKIKLNLKNNFILSAEIQSGPVGASFPFFDPSSSIKTHTRGAMTPDQDIFQELSENFLAHLQKRGDESCKESSRSYMKSEDLEYISKGILNFQFQVMCFNSSKDVDFDQLFSKLVKSLTGLVQDSHKGIKGTVIYENQPVQNAALKILGRDVYFHSDDRGYFQRLLLPGVYTLQISHPGFHVETTQIVVDDKRATNLIIRLQPSSLNKSTHLEERFDKSLVRRIKTFSLTKKDIKNLIEWSFSLLNIINILNIVGFLM